MEYNTALGFLFIGFHILTNIRGYRRVSILFASVVALLGALTLVEYAFNVNLWIDTLFVTPSIGVPNEIPGRIGANTAFCFFAVGMLLVLDALRVLKFRVIGIGAGLVGALAAVSLWGYLIGIPELTGWGGLLSAMAVHTSAAMIVVSLQDDVKIFIENELLDTHADRIRVIQVFQNLITNAMNYGRPLEGQHEIRIKSDEVDGMVRFSVSDNGPGIDPDSQEQIFGVFKRLQTDGEGAGIELSIVNRAVSQHGGRAWVESFPGNGATFFFTLPRYNIDSESRYPVEERKTTVA